MLAVCVYLFYNINMSKTSNLKKEIEIKASPALLSQYYMYLGYREALDMPVVTARAKAVEKLFTLCSPHIYKNDLIAGSRRGLFADCADGNELRAADELCGSFGCNSFWTNADHYSPAYARFLKDGVPFTIEKIIDSLIRYKGDKTKTDFLEAANISMQAFKQMILNYSAAAEKLRGSEGYNSKNLKDIALVCRNLVKRAPKTFREALQLVWFAHTAFCLEGRYAMALGRMDQYLYPFYRADIESNTLTKEFALELLENTLIKIGEHKTLFGHGSMGGDVVNICIGGVTENSGDAVNELSYLLLEAVKNCRISGPNLSARISEKTPDLFLDECLKVIGTGIGYPALMNDEVNMAALKKCGYKLKDIRDYSMVGCIENFITGKQPPWSDGRFNTLTYLESVFMRGKGILKYGTGLDTGGLDGIKSMDGLVKALEKQFEYGAALYMRVFDNENNRYNRINYAQPFLSCFCEGCIERGLDINNGGAVYPSVHGAGTVGIGTMVDSLAAIEKVVFIDKAASLEDIRKAVLNDFKGYEALRGLLLNAPKYGNGDGFADKYAAWYVKTLHKIFSKYRTYDGGRIYIAIASNVQNISCGAEIGATPDGRGAGQPLSDAASPSYGKDVKGPTAVVNSVTKPDYTLAASGTVLNQKYSPDIFSNEEKRKKLLALLRVYFKKGGQEMQINSVSRETLKDAIKNPGNYENLVVRVSGFSAYYIYLDKEVQEDILNRTEQYA